MNCSRTHDSRMIDYSAAVDGDRRLQNALYQYILGIRGRRTEGVSRSQIMKWFRGTPESFVVTALNTVVGDNKVILDGGKFRVKTVRDHIQEYDQAKIAVQRRG
jgi:hypothetical protein